MARPVPPLALAAWVDHEHDRIVRQLIDWLRVPSISAQPAHAGDVRRSAELAAGLLTEAGMGGVEILETGGAPAVYAEHLGAGPDAPTALVYGHHDVQPVDPLEEWRSPPFEPQLVDGELRARGAVDDKGQVLYQIEAARGLLAADGSLPLNLKFLVEGEEALGRVLEAPVLYLGIALPDDRFHAPNERLVMDQFWKGLLAAGELWRELAAPGVLTGA